MPPTTIRKTPGVYITELSAFPPSVVGVETAVPAFIGYTEKAEISGKPVFYTPVRLTSMADFETYFGGGFEGRYDLVEGANTPNGYDFKIGNKYFLLKQTGNSRFYLYYSLRLFYANGGGPCYIVSVGDYTDGGKTSAGVEIDSAKLTKGLTAIGDQVGPTLLAIPDAVLLKSDGTTPPTSAKFDDLVKAMLVQASTIKDRVGILDVYGTVCLDQLVDGYALEYAKVIEHFRDKSVGSKGLDYGMTYFPFLKASVVDSNEIDYTNFDIDDGDQRKILEDALKEEATLLYGNGTDRTKAVDEMIDKINPATTKTPEAILALNQNLRAALPVLGQIYTVIAGKLNILPPSGALAGVCTYNDEARGVWNAPANVALTSVIGPTLKITSKDQEDLNVPLYGQAINAIRDFVGRGTLVWGARTLDGNSADWRYIQVRRTLVFIEQSIKSALNQFVFAPNDGKTWVAVTALISNFLQSLWSQGGLMGAKASDAFAVTCGVGSTMTGQDVLDGYMIVQVKLQMVHPAEFIEVTFKQQMQGVA